MESNPGCLQQGLRSSVCGAPALPGGLNSTLIEKHLKQPLKQLFIPQSGHNGVCHPHSKLNSFTQAGSKQAFSALVESDGEQTCNHFKVLVAISFSIPEHNPPFHLLSSRRKSSTPLFSTDKSAQPEGKRNTVAEIRCQIRIKYFILYKNWYFPQHLNASDQ